MKEHFPKTERLKEIVTVLTHYRAVECLARQQNPELVRQAFEELGPSFIKIGQILSLRADIIQPDFAQELGKLQGQVKSDDFSIIKPLIEQATGLPVEAIFASLEEEAFASASIAQVHRGTLKGGQSIVVKVQHPTSRETMLRDIGLLEMAVPLIKHIPATKIVDPAEVVKELKRSLLQELDFTIETEYTERFYRNNREEPQIRSPRVYAEYSSETLMIMDFMPGQVLSAYLDGTVEEAARQTFAANKAQIAQIIVTNYMKQIFEDGFFHADPHPGNILLDFSGPEPHVVYLDFGTMGEVDESTIRKFNDLLAALATQNPEGISQAILRICRRERHSSTEDLNERVMTIFEQYAGLPLDELSMPQILNDISRLCQECGLAIPENVALLFKGIITLEGLIEKLDPTLSLLQAVKPYVMQYMKESFDFKEEVLEFAKHIVSAGKDLPQLPRSLLSFFNKANAGKLKLTLDVKNLDNYFDRFESIINRLAVSVVLAALILGFSMLLQDSPGNLSVAIASIGITGLILVLIIIIGLTLRFMRKRK